MELAPLAFFELCNDLTLVEFHGSAELLDQFFSMLARKGGLFSLYIGQAIS
jgi:hypothetical protein